MTRDQFVLASMAIVDRKSLSPVQVQKFFFLLDKNIASDVEGPHFDFQPYDYGPFDKDVYTTLDEMREEGLVEIVYGRHDDIRKYRLSDKGYRTAQTALTEFSAAARKYAQDVVEWITPLTFVQIVSAIYRAYPEMKTKSVFQETA